MQGARQGARLGLEINYDVVNQNVLDFVGKYTDEWWAQLSKSTEKGLRTAIEKHVAQNTSMKDLLLDIEPLFGEQRAGVVATTEVTRLYAEGNKIAYADAGVQEVEWLTTGDPCPLCEELEGQTWTIEDAETPPLHVGCLCWLAPIVNDKLLDELGELS